MYLDISDILEKDNAVKDSVYGKFINHLGTSSVLITISKVAPATTNNTNDFRFHNRLAIPVS